MISRFRNNWLIILIFLVALILRLYNLSGIPVGVHGDEASIGYNAYSILKIGFDQNGKFLPLVIDQFGDFRPPGYHYLDIPLVAIFGLNELSVRLPSAIFGSLTIIAFYFLLIEIFAGNGIVKKRIALIGAGLLAISPWHIIISRATSESVIAAFFIILGVYSLIKGYKKKEGSLWILLLSFLFFLISFFFYHSARFFAPAFIIPLITILFLQFKIDKRKVIYCTVLFVILLSFLYILLNFGSGGARPLNVSIFNSTMSGNGLAQQIGEDGVQNPYITRFFHNKLFFYGRIFLTNYFMHFNGDFLFINNGLPIRYRVPWSGNLNLIDIPFLLFGFSVLLVEGVKSKKYWYFIPLVWLFVGAIPAGLTWEDIPNIQRSSLMIYALLAIVAFGINELLSVKRSRLKIVTVVFFLFLLTQNTLSFFHNYFYHSPIHEPWYRSAAVKEVVFVVEELAKNYETIEMTTQNNNNLVHHLFYSKFDPEIFRKLGSPKEEENLHFGKLVFTGHPCPIDGDPELNTIVAEGVVYINTPLCKLPKNAEIIKTIRHPDGTPAFEVVKLNPFIPDKIPTKINTNKP